MASDKANKTSGKKALLREATEALKQLGFGPRQSNDVAVYVLLALLGLKPAMRWKDATHPLMGITPIIDFVAEHFGLRYAPNTRETIRDEAVKYFVEYKMVVRNPDDPNRPTNSVRTAYQIESSALLCFVRGANAIGNHFWLRISRTEKDCVVTWSGIEHWLASRCNCLTERPSLFHPEAKIR